MDHAITSFHHVRLPHSALLGALDKPKDTRKQFLSCIWRIGVGTLALPLVMITAMKRSVFVAGKYSQRRHILGPDQKHKPIISFRTQYGPILHALAQISVLEAYTQQNIQYFQDPNLARPVRHAIGAMAKAVLYKTCQASLFTLSERCGAQGLYENNHIIESMLETRGMSIAEGDTLVLSIRMGASSFHITLLDVLMTFNFRIDIGAPAKSIRNAACKGPSFLFSKVRTRAT